jgi:hypothetical protein
MPRRPGLTCVNASVAALAVALPGVAMAQGLDTTWRAGVGSAWLVRGVSLSAPGKPVVFADANAYAAGWSFGGLLGHFETDAGETATAVNLRAGHEWTLDARWSVMAHLRHLSYPGAEGLRPWCYNEVGASLADADRWLLSWSAETRRGPGCNDPVGPVIVSRSLELNGRWPLSTSTSLGGGIGRRMYGARDGYLFGQAGLAWQHGGLQLLLDRVWVSPQATRYYYSAIARDRWVATATWSF